MLRMFSSSLPVILGLLLAAWLSPASALQCAAGNGQCFALTGNTNATTAWSQTSGGSNCGCVPASTDTVIFDANSAAMTVNAAFSIGSLDATSYTGTLTHNTSQTITVNGASNGNGIFKFGTGMTYTPASTSSLISFVNTGAVTLTSGGKNLAAITINAGAGSVLQGDNLSMTAVQNGLFTHTSGTFSQGSFNTTVPLFVSSNANNRTLTLGGTLKVGGNVTTAQSLFNLTTTTGLVLNKNSGIIEIAAPNTAIGGATIASGGMAFNGLVVDASPTFGTGLQFNSIGVWTTWTIGQGWTLQTGSSQTLSGAAAFNGTSGRWNSLLLTNLSSTVALSSSGCTATYTNFSGITIPTGCTASNSNNLGGNAGLTVTAPYFGGIIGG